LHMFNGKLFISETRVALDAILARVIER
jgi:hypothetical protein